MAVMERPAWTDDRLDDLSHRVEVGFSEMGSEFRAVRNEMDGIRQEMRGVREEIGALNRTIHQFMFAMVGTVFLGFTGTIAALTTLV